MIDMLHEELQPNLEAPDANGKTALHLAVTNNRKATVERLLDLGARATPVLKTGQWPLHLATECGHYSIM